MVDNYLLMPGVFITMVVFVVISLVLISTGKLANKNNKDKSQDNMVTRKAEYEKIEDINSSYGYNSTRKKDEYMVNHIGENYKNSTFKEKILGGLFLSFLMINFILIFVFSYLHIMVGTYVCFAIFGLTILLSGLIKFIFQKVSINVSPEKIENSPKLNGIVDACVLSSSTSTGGSERRHTQRIIRVTYKVMIFAGDRRYIAYSNEFFEKGERVTIAAIGKNRAAIINHTNNNKIEE